MIRALRPALAATVLTVAAGAVAAGVLPPTAAASAAAGACSSGTGVTVVVDFNSLGGGVQGDCVADGGSDRAGSLFRAAGFQLREAARFPGFVCRISDLPASDPCVNASPPDAYWSLWWSDGRTGRWTYSSLGISSLQIPDGGSVAFSYDDRAGSSRPSFVPPANAPDPTQEPTRTPSEQPTRTPSEQPSRTPSEQPSEQPSTPTQTPSSQAPTSAIPTASPSRSPRPSRTPTRRPTTSGPTSDTTTSTAPDDGTVDELAPVEPVDATGSEDDGGLPGWVAPGVIVLLFAGAGVALVLRRRGTPAP